ncbi:hypothetical protein B0H14DRAFT_57275 [Mycena olivaceomarginata]|nr:hypothetical protein B0H14DRAFT_57275 [Mycena olivaceomarginata]
MRVGCEHAKEEVKLSEMEKRAAAGGTLGGTESRAWRSCASILARIRARSASKECHLACVSRARLHAGACGRAHIGGLWNEERGVYARQRCEDGIAEYAQVMLHAARDALAWSTTGCGVGVGGEGAPEVLARRFERNVPRIDGLVNEKMTRCNASPVPSMVRKYDE